MNPPNIRQTAIAATAACILSTGITATAVAGEHRHRHDGHDRDDDVVTIYFTRHAEKQTTLERNTDGHLQEVCVGSKCAEELNALGEKRAELLADWFLQKGITQKLTHAFSSHKKRTRQTIAQIAEDADLGKKLKNEDKNPGDGIQEFPIFNDLGGDAVELDPTSTSGSIEPTITALNELQPGDVALVAGHSGTLYEIMEGLGLSNVCSKANVLGENLETALADLTTCNQDRYPVKDDDKRQVRDFGDIWKIELRDDGAHFVYRVNLDYEGLFVLNATR